MAFNPLAALVSGVEVRTAYTPPETFSADEIWNLPSTPASDSAVGRAVRPTLIVRSPLGDRVVAPYGEASADEWQQNRQRAYLWGAGAVLLVFGLGFLLGRRTA